MDFQHDKNLLRSLLLQGDLLQTINGGSVAAVANMETSNNNYIIKIKAPSVAAESFEVIQNNNALIIYALYKIEKDGESRSQPLFVQNFIIPAEADLDHIEAFYRDGELVVVIPLQLNTINYKSRKIKIRNFDR